MEKTARNNSLKVSDLVHTYMYTRKLNFDFEREKMSRQKNGEIALDLSLGLREVSKFDGGDEPIFMVSWEASVAGLIECEPSEVESDECEREDGLIPIFTASVLFDHVYRLNDPEKEISPEAFSALVKKNDKKFRSFAIMSATNAFKTILTTTPLAGMKLPYNFSM